VSRLFPERVTMHLATGEVRVDGQALACDPGYGKEPWQGAIAGLRAFEWKTHCKVTVVLSNDFVRYAIVPWHAGLDTPEEEEAYVRHHFAKIHGERARAWALRWNATGDPRLASAIDRPLFEELKAAFPKGGKAHLVSVQPHLMEAANRWRRAVPASGAWLVLADRERACVALHARGQWRAVQNAKGDWLALLERERHRIEGDVPDLALVAGARPDHDAPGWRFKELAA
jgi:hypothetical protein